jgi:hypothetical protein
MTNRRGPTERAVDRTLTVARRYGLLDTELDAALAASIRQAARGVDAAGTDAGKLGYSVSVLTKTLDSAGLLPDSKPRRRLASVLHAEAVTRQEEEWEAEWEAELAAVDA